MSCHRCVSRGGSDQSKHNPSQFASNTIQTRLLHGAVSRELGMDRHVPADLVHALADQFTQVRG